LKYAAFYRNVNLGQPKSPTKIQLESALISAGAEIAQSFQSNGTAIFTASTAENAGEIVMRSRQILKAECGLEEPAYVCDLQHLAEMVAADPFANANLENVYGYFASFLPPEAITRLQAPLQSPRGDVDLLLVTHSAVLSLSRMLGASPGDPTPFLEKLLQVPVTSRSWNTIVRLVNKFA